MGGIDFVSEVTYAPIIVLGEERLWITTDDQLDDVGVVVVLDRPVQGALALSVRDAEEGRVRLDLAVGLVASHGGAQGVPLVLLVDVHSPAGAARVSVRSGEGEREEWSCGGVCLSLV